MDDAGKITALVDWECVSALPLWMACHFPQFLQGREREEEPVRSQFGEDLEDESDNPAGVDALDNEGVTILYWQKLREYEQTVLRRSFLRQMEDLEPDWLVEREKGTTKADFEKAIEQCDDGFCFKMIRKWLDSLEGGENRRLRERMLQ